MKVPWKWLNEYVALPWDPEETARRFTMAGLSVENLSYERLHASRVVSAKIVDVKLHPSRQHLKVGILDTGKDKFTIVSGAPQFKKGNIVLLAMPGATLPGGIGIKPREFSGVISQGTVLSSNELLTGQRPRPREDIVVLSGNTPLGKPVQDIFDLDDWVFELELTVNYSHCLSVLGVAIEASALSGRKLRLPPVLEKWNWAGPVGSKVPGRYPSDHPRLRIELLAPDLCPRYVGKSVRDVSVGYSPVNIERRLWLSGMRPINSVVDVTNYILLETGQPLHAFDEDKIEGETILVRRALHKEQILTLDGEKRVLPEDALVIADKAGPLAIAGVMGGKASEVTLNTKNVLIESAYFSPRSVRMTSKKLRLRTEAALRFEKGVDPTAQVAVAERAAELISTVAGGKPVSGCAEGNVLRYRSKKIMLSETTVRRNLGMHISQERCKKILSNLRFKVEDARCCNGSEQGKALYVTVPPRRVDITQEIDLVEEIARHYGYENFEERYLSKAILGGPPDKRFVWTEKIRDFLVSLGGLEAVTNSLLTPSDLGALGWGEDDSRGKPVPLKNPLSSSESVLRTSLLPGLLKSVLNNQKAKVPGVFLWEIGRVFFPSKDSKDELPVETKQLAMASYGSLTPKTWLGGEIKSSFFYLKGVTSALLSLIGLENLTFLPCALMPLHPGKSARVIANGSTVGEVGEIHPFCQKSLGLVAPVAMAWLSLDVLLSMAKEKKYVPISRFMPVERDLAVVVPEDVPAGQVLDAVKETARNLVSATLFDIWRKAPVPEGKKSLAVRLVYQAHDRTLTEEELLEDRRRILKKLEEKFGARQRL